MHVIYHMQVNVLLLCKTNIRQKQQMLIINK